MILIVSTYILIAIDFQSKKSHSEKSVVLKAHTLKMDSQRDVLE